MNQCCTGDRQCLGQGFVNIFDMTNFGFLTSFVILFIKFLV